MAEDDENIADLNSQKEVQKIQRTENKMSPLVMVFDMISKYMMKSAMRAARRSAVFSQQDNDNDDENLGNKFENLISS